MKTSGIKRAAMTSVDKRLLGIREVSFVGILAFIFLGIGCVVVPVDTQEPLPEQAAEEAAEVDVGVDILNKYVWRGMVLSDVPVAQPSITVAKNGFSINVWGSMDLDEKTHGGDTDNQYQFNEIDYTVGYDYEVGPVGLSGGLVHYTFPNIGLPNAGVHPGKTLKDGDTTELYAGIGFDVVLSPSITAYWDVDEGGGANYISFDVGHTFDVSFLSDRFEGLDIGAGMGWGSSEYNRFYYGGSPRNPGAAMTDVRASLSLPFGLCECGACGWTLVPMLMYSSILDKDLRHNHSQEDSSLFWGVSLSIPF